MYRKYVEIDFDKIYEIINEASIAYKGIIPTDRWKEPYMSKKELKNEIDSGIEFWSWEENMNIVAVMGIQNIKDVTLIRHAYTLSSYQRKGIGSNLLNSLSTKTARSLLVGTWADAKWAIKFYQKHNFNLVTEQDKNYSSKKVLEYT